MSSTTQSSKTLKRKAKPLKHPKFQSSEALKPLKPPKPQSVQIITPFKPVTAPQRPNAKAPELKKRLSQKHPFAPNSLLL